MSILDLGCGTGTWAIEMAREYPLAQITGIDLNPPTTPAPPHVTFLKADIEQPWVVGQFDFIHGRMLVSAVTDWPSLLKRCSEHLNPGGLLELPALSYPFHSEDPEVDQASSPFLRYGEVSEKAWKATGHDMYSGPKLASQLQELGFQKIVNKDYKWPIGSWGSTNRERQGGALLLEDFKMFCPASGRLLAHVPDITNEAVEQLVEETLEDVTRNCEKNKYYFTL
ncbi:MAG: hypothetical protein Q9183_006828 [Haloplaca sp. 2 TL-2023]